MSAVYVAYPQQYFPELDVALGKLGFGEASVPWSIPDTFVRLGFEFDCKEAADRAYDTLCELVYRVDAIGSWIWRGIASASDGVVPPGTCVSASLLR